MERATDYSARAAEYQLGYGCDGAERGRAGGTRWRNNLPRLDRDDALAALKKSSVPATSRKSHPRELFDDPQVVANDLIAELSHSQWGRVNQTGMLTKFSATPGTIERAAPMLGEHTDEILREYLGYSPDRIASAARRGIVK